MFQATLLVIDYSIKDGATSFSPYNCSIIKVPKSSKVGIILIRKCFAFYKRIDKIPVAPLTGVNLGGSTDERLQNDAS